MKLIITAIAVGVVAHLGGFIPDITPEEEALPIEAAVSIRCDDLGVLMRQECADRYEEEFQTGERDPLAVIRQHCTRWKSSWELGPSDDPPAICREQFGGWLES